MSGEGRSNSGLETSIQLSKTTERQVEAGVAVRLPLTTLRLPIRVTAVFLCSRRIDDPDLLAVALRAPELWRQIGRAWRRDQVRSARVAPACLAPVYGDKGTRGARGDRISVERPLGSGVWAPNTRSPTLKRLLAVIAIVLVSGCTDTDPATAPSAETDPTPRVDTDPTPQTGTGGESEAASPDATTNSAPGGAAMEKHGTPTD